MPTDDPAPIDDAPLDDEYELEDPDEDVLQLARERTAENLRAASVALEVDDAQRAMEERHVFSKDDSLRFQFQVKHLLIATAVLAIVMTLAQFAHGVAVLMVGVTAALIATHTYLNWAERKRLDEASARRAEAFRRVRERQAAAATGGPAAATMYDEQLDDDPLGDDPRDADPDDLDQAAKPRFQINFGMADMLLAFTVAAVVLGIGAAISFKLLSVVLGLVAVVGLLAYGVGIQPPSKVVTIWWVTLVMYVVLSFLEVVGVIGGE